MIRVGVDVGGTFTDAVFFDEETQAFEIRKVSSTPGKQQIGVMNALQEYGFHPADMSHFFHGTTVATNAVIEKNGAQVGLITTKGFRDVLKIRRTTRGKLYDLQWDPPRELVERRFRVEVDERIDAYGEVLTPLNHDQLLEQADFLIKNGIDSIAICYLNSYVNSLHEEMAKEILLEKYPYLYVTTSSELLREWREFERTSTAVVAAYIGPLLNSYLMKLSSEMKEKGYQKDILLMLSNGGVAPAFPVNTISPKTLLSGPAASAIGMKDISERAGERSVISIDIGGTSTDIAIAHEGELLTRTEQEIEFGTVVKLPIIDVETIGAGGGTIASIDQGGLLSMGPESAGALPGPVCYDKGGKLATLTDANVVLGRLNSRHLLDGKFLINAERAKLAIEEQVGKPLGMTLHEAAMGMIKIVNQNISNAIRRLALSKGLDVREFALFANGGGGPLQAVEVASELGMKKIIIPTYPGITSAIGLLASDVKYDYVESYIVELSQERPEKVIESFRLLVRQAEEDLKKSGFATEKIMMRYAMDLRYFSQTHELSMEIKLSSLEGSNWLTIREQFKKLHKQVFGYSADLMEPLELVKIRVVGTGLLDKPEWNQLESHENKDVKEIEKRSVYFHEYGMLQTPVYRREDLLVGWKSSGPAVIEQLDTTILIPPNVQFNTDSYGNLKVDWSEVR